MTANSAFILLIAGPLVTIGMAAFGYLMNKWSGAIFLCFLSAVAAFIYYVIVWCLPVLMPLSTSALVTIVLMAALGYVTSKRKGAVFLYLLTSGTSILCLIQALSFPDWIPLVVSAFLAIEGTIALGYSLSRGLGTVVLWSLSELATTICLVAAVKLSWLGLLGAVIVVAVLAAVAGHKLSGYKGARFVGLLWIGWCAFCLFGYGVASLWGLALITLPCVALFWVGAYFVAQRALPLPEKNLPMNRRRALGVLLRSLLNPDPQADELGAARALLFPLLDKAARMDRLHALQAMLTFTLGTNFPYYAVENRKLATRVRGNPFGQFFAGPGIVITSCDHAVVTTDGIKIIEVKKPGLSFTGRFEREPVLVDLRCQLRTFNVEALTKGGIRIKVLTFVPFRIHADGWPEQGKPFPFRKKAVVDAILARPVEHTQEAKDGKVVENKKPLEWYENVQIVATRAVRRIISDYTFDDLCAPYDPERDPRSRIVSELRRQLWYELRPMGIEALGGGISNLEPADKEKHPELLQRRIDNWQAEWSRRVSAEMGKADAEYIHMVEAARAQAQAEMIRTISEGFEKAGPVEDVSKVIALRFIEAIEKMIESPAAHKALPPSSVEAMEVMRHAIEAKSH